MTTSYITLLTNPSHHSFVLIVHFHAELTGDVDICADTTDSEDEKEDRNSLVSDNFFGMSRELRNLILENTELLATTKNALNIVKDELIANVDDLSSEQEILREEILSLKGVYNKLKGRIKELEDDPKKTKGDLEKKSQQAQEGENGDDVHMAQRKRFPTWATRQKLTTSCTMTLRQRKHRRSVKRRVRSSISRLEPTLRKMTAEERDMWTV